MIMTKKTKKPRYPRWLNLFLYENCFNDNEGTHLGFKFRGVFYCITHSKANGFEIPKKYLNMKDISNKPEYLKKCISTPVILHRTGMKINEQIIVHFILEEMNKSL